jgi:hypothetical protein
MSLLNFPSSRHIIHAIVHIVINKFFFISSLLLQCVVHNTRGAVRFLWSRVSDSLICVPSWNFASKKSSRTFVMPARTRCARTRLLSWVPRVGYVTHVRYAAHVRRTPRTSLRSHSTCLFPSESFFFYFCSKISQLLPSRDRVINAPCDPSAPRFSPPVPAPFLTFF